MRKLRVVTGPGETFAHRVWYAWHALPRDAIGRPPSWRSLERKHDLPEAVFSQIVNGHRKTIEAKTAVQMAAALNVSLDWLIRGLGRAPKPTGPVPPLPEAPGAHTRVEKARGALRKLGFAEEQIDRAIAGLESRDDPQLSTPIGVLSFGEAAGLFSAIRGEGDEAGGPRERARQYLRQIGWDDARIEEALGAIARIDVDVLSAPEGTDARARVRAHLERTGFSNERIREALFILFDVPEDVIRMP